jgi:hypothetical protein
MRWLCALCLLIASSVLGADDAVLAKLERSYWLHASLASLPQKGYWGQDFPSAAKPAEAEIRNAARLLAGDYAANRLYLIYHNEIPPADAEQVFASWRRHCPAEVEIVPTLVLRAYDKQKSEVFSADELSSWPASSNAPSTRRASRFTTFTPDATKAVGWPRCHASFPAA